jgi:hypothetical protein
LRGCYVAAASERGLASDFSVKRPIGTRTGFIGRALKWNQRCRKLAPLVSKNPEQYPTKEQQKACLEMAAAELIQEIRGRSLN